MTPSLAEPAAFAAASPTRLRRARLYGILDTAYVGPDDLVAKCRGLLAGGADIIQFRAKHESSTERASLLETIFPLFEDTDVPLILNDDLEVATLYPGVGLHVGQDDLDPRLCRDRLGPDRILGLSTHSEAQATAAMAMADVLDYFAVGPVFATPTKPTYGAVGPELVSFVAAQKPVLPWFAIGGVNAQTVDRVTAAGARAVVAVSALLKAASTAEATRQLREQVTAA
ncbi:MAG: thiamine phosphate synthase [Opitutales bacterium]